MFFYNGKTAYGLRSGSAHLFNPLPPDAVTLVVTALYHAIAEYEFGVQRVRRWDGNEIGCMLRSRSLRRGY